MKYPRIWGDRQGNDVARIVGEAKVRALQAVDAPYLSASGPGFVSRKSGEFQNVTLRGHSTKGAERVPNLISVGWSGNTNNLNDTAIFTRSISNDRFEPPESGLSGFRERDTDRAVTTTQYAVRHLGGSYASMFSSTEGVIVRGKWGGFSRVVDDDFTGINTPVRHERHIGETTRSVVGEVGAYERVMLTVSTPVSVSSGRTTNAFRCVAAVLTEDEATGRITAQYREQNQVSVPFPAAPPGLQPLRAEIMRTWQLAADWVVAMFLVTYSAPDDPIQVGQLVYLYDSTDAGRTWSLRGNALPDGVSIPSGPRTVIVPRTPDDFLLLVRDTRGSTVIPFRFLRVARDWSVSDAGVLPASGNFGSADPYAAPDLALHGARCFQTLPTGLVPNTYLTLYVSTDLGQTWAVKAVPGTTLPASVTNNERRDLARRIGQVFPLGKRTLGYVRYEATPTPRYVLMVSRDLGDSWYDHSLVSEGRASVGAAENFRRDHAAVALIGSPQLPAEKLEPLPWRRDARVEYTPDVWEP